MKKKQISVALSLLILVASTSCKKCYECVCTSPQTDPLFGCTVQGQTEELCGRNSITGRTILSTNVMIKESEGYSCTLK